MTVFRDRVAVITGGTGVLGRAVTRLFVAEGARVTVPCRSAEDAQALREELGDRAGVLLAERPGILRTAAGHGHAGALGHEQTCHRASQHTCAARDHRYAIPNHRHLSVLPFS